MFRKNTKHQQPALISAASELPEKQRRRLEKSWADTFFNQFFLRINEEAFSVLYSDKSSRPNVPVNVLVGLEALKAGFGWSDEELYENYCYNLQVRYALGYDRLGDGDFEIRTLYYFRERLSKYNQEHGVNLLEKAFEGITDAQITALKVRTRMQRMDSTQIASNIVWSSRIRLLVEGLQRLERILSEADKKRLAETLAPYTADNAGHYTYRLKNKEEVQGHLQVIGQLIYRLLQELKEGYEEKPAYQVLARLFEEQFQVKEEGAHPKENQEISAGSLQSVDDLDATFRSKGNAHYKGYVANITETCDPENEVQLITKVQVAPNNVDDNHLLVEALPNLKERTGMETLITDGGYGGEISDQVLQEQAVQLQQSAIRGHQPNPSKMNLSAFTIKFNAENKPSKVTCPQGQIVTPQTSVQKKAFTAIFTGSVCQTCPLADQCLARPGKRDADYHLRFTHNEALAAGRRQRYHAQKGEKPNLRAAVEASVRSVKHPFPAGKLPVRGKFRVACMMIGSAAVTNVRRIQRCLEARMKAQKAELEGKNASASSSSTEKESFLHNFWRRLAGWLRPKPAFNLVFGC